MLPASAKRMAVANAAGWPFWMYWAVAVASITTGAPLEGITSTDTLATSLVTVVALSYTWKFIVTVRVGL